MSDGDYTVNVTLRNERVIVSRVSLQPGAETEVHAHEHDYVVVPHQPTTVLKTSFQGGQVVGQEQIEHKPGEPYFVGASADGITFTLKNIGDGPMLCDKTFIRK